MLYSNNKKRLNFYISKVKVAKLNKKNIIYIKIKKSDLMLFSLLLKFGYIQSFSLLSANNAVLYL
jgi:hypothetical protein